MFSWVDDWIDKLYRNDRGEVKAFDTAHRCHLIIDSSGEVWRSLAYPEAFDNGAAGQLGEVVP